MKAMKNLFLLLCFVLITQLSFSQEDVTSDDNQKGEWIGGFHFGFATLTAEDVFKGNANIQGATIAKEFILNNKSSIIAGIETYRATADFTDALGEQLFLTNQYIAVPVSYRMVYNRSAKISPYIDLGIYGSYLLKSELENEALNTDDDEKGLGFNFGIQANFGARFTVAEDFSIFLGLHSRTDLIDSYKSSRQEFELTEMYLFKFGFGFKF